MKSRLLMLSICLISVKAQAMTIKVTQDADMDVTLESFSGAYGYQTQIRDENGQLIDNPESKIDFATRKIKEFIQESAVAYDANREVEFARKAEITNAKQRHVVNIEKQ